MLEILLLICTSLSLGVLPGESLQNKEEVVFPELFNARDESGTKTLKINDEVTLQLKKSTVLHDEFFLETHRDGVPLVTYPDVEKFEEDLYHDETRLASVFVTEENGFVKVEGVVGPNLKIRPLEGAERGNEGFFPHALELISKEPENIQTVHGEHIQARNDQGTRRVINIRIRYLTVGDPAIHLKFRAIEVLAEQIECDYYVYLDDYKVDGIATIYSLVKYVEDYKFKYQRYDIVMVLTGYDMVRVNEKGEWETSYRVFN
ncbi:venom metalloproteinase antarease-like TtrivMP_A [Haemaphysalis longicornis]